MSDLWFYPAKLNGRAIELMLDVGYVDLYRIGKLNYHPSEIDWAEFGRKSERLCKLLRLNYYIKNDLRKAMNGADGD